MKKTDKFLNYTDRKAERVARLMEQGMSSHNFTMRYPAGYATSTLPWAAVILLLGVFFHIFTGVLWAYMLCYCIGGAFLLLMVDMLVWRAHVDQEAVVTVRLGVFRKKVIWTEIDFFKIQQEKDDSKRLLLLKNGKKVLSFPSETVGFGPLCHLAKERTQSSK